MCKAIMDILESIERPLIFISKNEFININKIAGLHDFLKQMRIKANSLDVDNKITNYLLNIEKKFEKLGNMGLESQKMLIVQSLGDIKKLKKMIARNHESAEQNESNNIRISSSSPVQFVKGVGPKISAILAKKNIRTIEDLIYYFPRGYEDRREIKKISKIKLDSFNTIFGRIEVSEILRRKTRNLFHVVVSDDTGYVNLVWFQFNQKYLKNLYKKGSYVVVSGVFTFDRYSKNIQITHPKHENIEVFEDKDHLQRDNINFNRIVPVYPLTEGLKHRRLRRIIKYIMDNYIDEYDYQLPADILKNNKLMQITEAIKQVHFPANDDVLVDLERPDAVYNSMPHKTVAFYELFMLQLGLSLKKQMVSLQEGISFKINGTYTQQLLDKLDYRLTAAQDRVISEIFNDLEAPNPMNRMLQGDVGSGKTIVSLFAMLKVCESGYQCVLMAPTEILAEQHYNNITTLLSAFEIEVVLIKSAISKKTKNEILEKINSGKANIIIGTHAAFQEGVEYFKLGLVIIDEQHRFGVIQRSSLIKKGLNPDVLIMTATPIPRTLSMAYFSDLDLSVIDEMPLSRIKIETKLFYNDLKSRIKAYDIVKSELVNGRQAYIIAPFIEESEADELKHLKDVGQLADELKAEFLQGYKISILHGQMSSEDKDKTMNAFKNGDIDILVSTSVIEVGIDVPNATIIVIENAERFGLSQLHQLRGRVGRGVYQSKCLLLASYKKSELADKRLSILEKTNDGFKIAETDLLIRGPGEFIGTKQSGLPELKFANIIRDSKILLLAKKEASRMVAECKSEGDLHYYIDLLRNKWGDYLDLASVS